MIKKRLSNLALPVLMAVVLSHQQAFTAPTSAPEPEARVVTTKGNSFAMTSKACRDWQNFMFKQGHIEGGLKTDQLVVMRGNGDVLFDEAVAPYRKNTRHTMWSVSKMITATTAATAIQEGKLKLSDRLDQFLPVEQRRNPEGQQEYRAVTVQNLISMTSGLKWSEHNGDEAKQASDLPLMYSQGYRDFTRYMTELDFESKPGKAWNYSSVNANLVMAILKKVYRGNYDKMPWKNLFTPLGIKTAAIEQDHSGLYIGGSYVNLSAEDMAKIGKLFLNDGVVNGKRILPKGWVEHAKTAEPASLKKVHKRADFADYGVFSKGGWWLNRPVPGVGKAHPNSPETAMLSTGFLGQWLVVLPDEGLIIARTGHERDSERKIDKMITGALACFSKQTASAVAHRPAVR